MELGKPHAALRLRLETLAYDLALNLGSDAVEHTDAIDKAICWLEAGDTIGAYCAMSSGPRARQAMGAYWASRWVELEEELHALPEPLVRALIQRRAS